MSRKHALPPVHDEPVAVLERPRYRVRLASLTPLAHPELEVEAANEDEAKQRYMQRNGISASDHPFTVERL